MGTSVGLSQSRHARWARRNREKCNQLRRDWMKRNPGKRQQYRHSGCPLKAIERAQRYQSSVKGVARRLWRNAYCRARKKGLSFTLTLARVESLVEKGVCNLSGLPINFGKPCVDRSRAPSLDRKNNARGYTNRNVQLVCFQANLAKNVWSNKRLVEFCKAVVRKHERT